MGTDATATIELDEGRRQAAPFPWCRITMDRDYALFDLLGAFRQVTERYRLAHPAALEIRHQRFSVREKMEELLARLDERRTVPLLEFFGEFEFRAEAVTSFLAFLELIRLGVARAFQKAAFGEIHVTRTDLAFSAADVRDTYR